MSFGAGIITICVFVGIVIGVLTTTNQAYWIDMDIWLGAFMGGLVGFTVALISCLIFGL